MTTCLQSSRSAGVLDGEEYHIFLVYALKGHMERCDKGTVESVGKEVRHSTSVLIYTREADFIAVESYIVNLEPASAIASRYNVLIDFWLRYQSPWQYITIRKGVSE